MTTPDPAQFGRLDSWKAISAYLGRDERTLRRWERELGLPIRRVAGGRNASVFAYAAEIDAWLTRHEDERHWRDATTQPAAGARAVHPLALAIAAVVIAAAGGAVWWVRAAPIAIEDLRIDVSATGVTAYDRRGAEQWRHDFPTDSTAAIPAQNQASSILAGPPPTVLAATALRTRRDGQIDSGSLMAFTADGHVERTFAFDDQITVHGTRFGAPWGLTAFEVEAAPPHRIAVAGHHHVWDPGIVTVLDAQWRRRGTFVHPGWIETVRWISPTSLLIGGYSNARSGGMVALLHPDELQGQAPEDPGTPHHCETCGTNVPVRMVILPRSEVNLAAAAPFNRAVVQLTGSRVIARTVEVASEQGPADAIYEFTPSLDLIAATFSERYWDMHRALEAQGKLDHAVATCPERDGPAAYSEWDRLRGWQPVVIRRGPSERR